MNTCDIFVTVPKGCNCFMLTINNPIYICFRFVKCEKCSHFFVVLNEQDQKTKENYITFKLVSSI